jgi:hypothetical protein
MARKRFTAEQIVAILREAENLPTNEEVLRKHASNSTELKTELVQRLAGRF